LRMQKEMFPSKPTTVCTLNAWCGGMKWHCLFLEWNDFSTPPKGTSWVHGSCWECKLFGAVGQRFLLIFALKIWGNNPI